ncbi:LCP family protein [Yinghuangia sp. ASG 101]|uniref:LCP family protein n=1 Tax=Yinghuangia sp. ASG 101 TaxID=2896848 RepID=UPI001E44878A|nr:LCP family protein [Yinghuangia sp. ASG 101]UGQ09530.1 LCP family protein [Yinghuangia sp. ASG 101]
MNAGNAPGRGGPGDNDLNALNDADVADLWVMDPSTGSYRLRAPDAGGEAPSAGSPPPPGPPAQSRGGSDRLPAIRDGGARSGTGRSQAVSRTVAPPRTSPEADPARPAPSRTGRRAPKGPSKAKKRLKWTAISLAGLLVVIVAGAYGYYMYLNSRIKKTDRSAANEVPPSAADEFGRTPLNILLIGSDTRVGKGNQVGGEPGHEGLADSTILMHLSADRSNATMVSIPRDTMVDRPACKYDDDKVHPASTQKVQFNSTLATPPGAPCTVATVERMLGVQVDHYLLIDFNGVKEMTKAVGGVPINLCGPINDPVLPNKQGGTGLKLNAGPQRLQGNDALQFVRARHAFGDGSDLARIEAQKSFLMALAREIKGNAKWSNPKAVFDIAQAATGNLQVDRGLGTIDKLASLGNEIKKVPEERMAFTTLPNEPYPGNPDAWVQQRQPDATKLWEALRTDTAITKGNPATTPASSAPPAPAAPEAPPAPAPAPVDPATMKVNVVNTTDATKGKYVVEQLGTLGYKAKSEAATTGTRDNSLIRYPQGKADAARQLAAVVGISDLAIEESTSGTSTFELIIGSDFPNLDTPDAPIAGAGNAGSAPQSSAAGAPAATTPPVVEVPPAADLKLNTADNEACIPTNSKK